jgi:hypothetical protein
MTYQAPRLRAEPLSQQGEAWSGRELKRVVVGVIAMLAFLAATNRWYGWYDGIRFLHALDTQTYATIASAAPGFPDNHIGSAFTERFAFPWMAGSVATLFGGGVHVAFRLMSALYVIVTLGLLVDICRRLRLSVAASLLCIGVFALDPYVFRGAAITSSPVDDAFVVGTAIVMWGLVTVRFRGVVAGTVISILGRQTALLSIPAAGVWLYAGAAWRNRSRPERLLLAILPVGITIVLYIAIKLAVASFTYAFAPSIPADTIVPVVGNPGSITGLATHAVRVLGPLVVWGGCIAGVVTGRAFGGGRWRVPVEFWCALLIGVSIALQPLLISPLYRGFESNEQRLSTLGLFPLCVALAYLVREADASIRAAPIWALAGGGAALLLASFHDKFTTLGPNGNAQFAAFELFAAAVVGGLLAAIIGRRQRQLARSSTGAPTPDAPAS